MVSSSEFVEHMVWAGHMLFQLEESLDCQLYSLTWKIVHLPTCHS